MEPNGALTGGVSVRGEMRTRRGEVAVFVRIRPTAKFAHGLIECLPDEQTVNFYHRKDSKKLNDSHKEQLNSWSFRMHGVLRDVSQEDVYARVCQKLLQEALEGYNGTVLCFGQTGAGKTYTMTGSTQSYKERGIIPRALQEVFMEVKKRTEQSFSVHLSYLEIYNETLVDLLSPLQGSPHCSRSMVVMEEPGKGVFIRGLSLHPVHSEEEALNLLFEGEMSRVIGSHAMNRNSSRSHCIFTLHIESQSRILSDANVITSKLNLVDLAGSERLGKIGSEGQVLKEATYINKSLSFLEQVILALGDRRRDHVPFRQTKLTHALKDSLGGNCNTVLVANIYGEAAHIEETLSTLRFASRMKCVMSEPVINKRLDPALQIQMLQKEVQMLKEELSIHNKMVNGPCTVYEPMSEAQLVEITSQVRQYLDGSLKQISITNMRQVHEVFAQFKLAIERERQMLAQLCQTNNLVEKDPNANKSIPEWDKRGLNEVVEAGGFEAVKQPQRTIPAKVKPTKSRDKENHNRRQDNGSPALRIISESSFKSKLNNVQVPESESEPQDPDVQETQQPANEGFYLERLPSDPPSKAELFDDFKLGQGNKINSILKENKAVLLERCCLQQQLSEEVNTVKREIDRTTAAIEHHKDLQESQGRYLVLQGEQEINLLLQLKELKALYRQRYEALRSIKEEVNYCQHLVDQCRVRLLSEFETWYKITFLLPEQLEKPVDEAPAQGEDSQLSLERMENKSSDSCSQESFYNAQCRTIRRKNSRLLSFTPVQKNLSGGYRQRRLLPRLPPA